MERCQNLQLPYSRHVVETAPCDCKASKKRPLATISDSITTNSNGSTSVWRPSNDCSQLLATVHLSWQEKWSGYIRSSFMCTHHISHSHLISLRCMLYVAADFLHISTQEIRR